MEIKDIEFEFGKKYENLITEYGTIYKSHLEKLLKNTGLCNVDVKKKQTGQKGRLIIEPHPHSTYKYEIKFTPYRKDGNLSSKHEIIYYYLTDDKAIINEITSNFEKA